MEALLVLLVLLFVIGLPLMMITALVKLAGAFLYRKFKPFFEEEGK